MEDRIRVAQVVTRFVAGAGGVALRGAEALDPRRYDVAIVAAPDGGLLIDAERAGFEVIRVPDLVPEIDPVSDARALRQLCTIMTEGRFDVVHTHSAKAGALGRLAARATHTRAVIHTFHGFPFHEFQSPWRRWTYIEVERRLAAITDRFLAVGSAVAAEAVRRRIAPVDRIRVIDSAISDDVVPRSPAARFRARGLLGVPPGMQVVGAVGRLDEQKAPLDFVDAFARLEREDVLGVWVGDGPLRATVERDIRVAGSSERIVLLGHRRDVPELLPAFDVFALSSLYEGVPCAVVEAMRCGVPVVATAVNGVHEVVVPGRSGLLVPPRDPRSLARAVNALLDDPADAARLAAIGATTTRGSLRHPWPRRRPHRDLRGRVAHRRRAARPLFRRDGGAERHVPAVAGRARRARGVNSTATGPPVTVSWSRRALDVVLATAGLVVLSPILLAIAVAIRLESRGSGPVPPDPGRRRRGAVHDREVPVHALRGQRSGDHHARRPARHVGRAPAPPRRPRRTPTARQRAARGDDPRRATAGDAFARGAVPARAARRVPLPTRSHGSGAAPPSGRRCARARRARRAGALPRMTWCRGAWPSTSSSRRTHRSRQRSPCCATHWCTSPTDARRLESNHAGAVATDSSRRVDSGAQRPFRHAPVSRSNS